MTPAHIRQLVLDYPHLFPHGADEGIISCGDGWFALIDDMCGKIMNHLTSRPDVSLSGLQMLQVKEKFGGLRVSFLGLDRDEALEDILADIENRSRNTCEVTGEPGSLYERQGWLKTLSETTAVAGGYTKVNTDNGSGRKWLSLMWRQRD